MTEISSELDAKRDGLQIEAGCPGMRFTLAMRFVDTSILLYAVSTAREEKRKTAVALGLLEERDLALSVQILQEFYVQATRRDKSESLSHRQAVRLIESFLRYPVQESSLALMAAAFESADRFQISYWDAAVIEAARLLGCKTLLSEDLSHGQDYGGVQVENLFSESRRTT